MAKKKRGRPPKKHELDINEVESTVKMIDDTPPKTISDVSRRMKDIFGHMSENNIPYSCFSDAINRNPLDLNGFLNNPFVQNSRIKNSNVHAFMHSKETLMDALTNPENSESILQQTSAALFYSNYVYQNLIKLNRDVP